MQLPVHITITCDNKTVKKDLSCSLSDTPLTILLEALNQANLMKPTDKWSVETNREGLRLGERVWQLRFAGKALDLLQSLLLLPEAQKAGAQGLALEVGPASEGAASLEEELDQLRLAKQEWALQAQEYEKRIAEQAATIKQLEQRPGGSSAGGALSARREIDQLKQELQSRQQEWDLERQSYEERLALAGAGASSGAAAPAGAGGDFSKVRQQWDADRQEYETMIAELQEKVAQLESAPEAAAAEAPLSSQEATEIEQKLQKQQQEIDAERESIRQQKEELEGMEQEFRNIEVRNSRERADMNRQKAEFEKMKRQFDFLLSQATKKPDIEKALSPVIQLREQIRKSTGT